MVALGQTVTLVNKSGKVVSTSKHIVNVFKEAKTAYGDRKAEIRATRKEQQDEKDRKAWKQLEDLKLAEDDASSVASSRQSSRQGSRRGSVDGRRIKRKPVPPKGRHERPPVERGISDSFYVNDTSPRSHRPSPLRNGSGGSIRDDEPRSGELIRRHTYDSERSARRHRPTTARSASADDLDMDLAYGELPPPLPERKYDTEVELRMKMGGLQNMLDEFNCVQYSVTAIVENLQKNPDALAAVGLALAEISQLATKLAPGALMSMKGAFPAIIAILCSPEFAIAAGVGVGVTIIAFGGYKIIKKIKAKKEARVLENGAIVAPGAETPPNEMEDLRELDHIERWRRGIAEVESGSVGTSVDGEFITPAASRALIEQGHLTEADFKAASEAGGSEKKHRKKKTKSEKGSKSGSKTSKSKVGTKEQKKEPSGLRMLFKSTA